MLPVRGNKTTGNCAHRKSNASVIFPRRLVHPECIVLGPLLVFAPFLAALAVLLPPSAMAWNTPSHMLSGAIAYQILRLGDVDPLPRGDRSQTRRLLI
jgi:hypothetical protein